MTEAPVPRAKNASFTFIPACICIQFMRQLNAELLGAVGLCAHMLNSKTLMRSRPQILSISFADRDTHSVPRQPAYWPRKRGQKALYVKQPNEKWQYWLKYFRAFQKIRWRSQHPEPIFHWTMMAFHFIPLFLLNWKAPVVNLTQRSHSWSQPPPPPCPPPPLSGHRFQLKNRNLLCLCCQICLQRAMGHASWSEGGRGGVALDPSIRRRDSLSPKRASGIIQDHVKACVWPYYKMTIYCGSQIV